MVAFSFEDNNITASALMGDGGNVDIETQGIFGFEVTDQETALINDITASSESGVDGTVEISIISVDPSQNLTTLAEIVERNPKIAQNCRSGQSISESSFVDTGRGGLPADHSEALSKTAVWEDLRFPPSLSSTPTTRTDDTSYPTSPLTFNIIEAQGWTVNANGNVVLTVQPPTAILHSSLLPSATCQNG